MMLGRLKIPVENVFSVSYCSLFRICKEEKTEINMTFLKCLTDMVLINVKWLLFFENKYLASILKVNIKLATSVDAKTETN
jgi:hypothetical protein